MEKIFEDWRLNSKNKDVENYLFVRSLKMQDAKKVDKLSNQLHDEAFNKIDCLKCGNCCKVSKPVLDNKDIVNIAKHINKSVEQTKEIYLELDEDNDWTFNSLPCPFLGINNECGIYDSRPKDCREFPHTNKSGFASRSHQVRYNSIVCPATFYIVENLQKYFP
jgi:Fe-S-cluster containining protein